MYYRGDIEDNNVKFAGKCWKAVRTTDTGGIKLIYNGDYTELNKCNNTGTSTSISIEIEGYTIDEAEFFDYYNAMAFNGYMCGDYYVPSQEVNTWVSGAKFGSDFIYENGVYKLVDATATSADANHHYSCNAADQNATCETIRYVYYIINSANYYINLSDGESVEDAIKEMQSNKYDSSAKAMIDYWYETNMIDYTNRIEDTIYCNNRSSDDTSGWNPHGGDPRNDHSYSSRISLASNGVNLQCRKNDAFTVNNNAGNRALTYPAALITTDELNLAGASSGPLNNYYMKSDYSYWTMSPVFYSGFSAVNYYAGGYLYNGGVEEYHRYRPVISIKPGQLITKGTGTVADPYVIE